MSNLYVKLANKDLVLRDPSTKRPLPQDACYVPDTPFWRRRIKHKDVIEVERPAEVEGSDGDGVKEKKGKKGKKG